MDFTGSAFLKHISIISASISIIGLVISIYHLLKPIPNQEDIDKVSIQKTSFIICTGEYHNYCPRETKLFFPCGTSDEQAADHTCLGKPHTVKRIFTQGGNACGYAIIEVNCG